MKTVSVTPVLTVLIGAILLAVTSLPAQQSYDGRFDIAALKATAQQRFDCAGQDAVILAEGQQTLWLPDGRLSTTIHRIVWINSRLAIGLYADNRIPYDHQRCTFTPLALRTWRDNQWWPTDTTGFVETLPFAVNKAYDYAHMREMMLLHNGISDQCLVEMAYRIEDKAPFRGGADGFWLFAREEPAVESWFELGVPAGAKPTISIANGAPAAEQTSDPKSGLDIYRWNMSAVAAEPRPHVPDPARTLPHIVWSTWPDWRERGARLKSAFDAAAQLDPPLSAAVDSLKRAARSATELAGMITGFINDKTAGIHYPEIYWRTALRPAGKTFATAYGHSLDRAILAAALFRGAGFEARPVYIGQGVGPMEVPVPSLARFGEVKLHLTGNGLEAFYDPWEGTISFGRKMAGNRVVWSPGEDRPTLVSSGTDDRGEITVRIELSFEAEKNKFTGAGYLSTDGGLCAFDRMSGVDGKAKGYLNALVSGLLKGTGVTEYTPDRFEPAAAAATFTMELAKPEPNDLGAVPLVLGNPIGGIIDNLPSGIEMVVPKRWSSVYLPFPMTQRIELRLNLRSWQAAFFPVNQTIENAVGRFTVASEVKDSQLVVIRALQLTKTIIEPEEWPLLRQLLLADSHEKNRTILLKEIKKDEQAGK
ncbi:MAG: DUF3857 domain-containing protein [candidate division Zixibacteria bacterium]|nr:DUF3857 domain-containing protein [candidate division Zixibacteria bacterium]